MQKVPYYKSFTVRFFLFDLIFSCVFSFLFLIIILVDNHNAKRKESNGNQKKLAKEKFIIDSKKFFKKYIIYSSGI